MRDYSDVSVGYAVTFGAEHSLLMSARDTWWPAAGPTLRVLVLVSEDPLCYANEQQDNRLPTIVTRCHFSLPQGRWSLLRDGQNGIKHHASRLQPLWQHFMTEGRGYNIKLDADTLVLSPSRLLEWLRSLPKMPFFYAGTTAR